MKNEMKTLALFCFSACMLHVGSVEAQSKLYPRLFDLQEVTLNDGVFKTAMVLNDRTLLEYDVDRLLTPYMRQAGFTDWEKEHPNFSNWGSGNFRLDGHVGGHYLSALALAYAASDDEEVRARMKERLDYMVDKMDECQRVFDQTDFMVISAACRTIMSGLAFIVETWVLITIIEVMCLYIQCTRSMPDCVMPGCMQEMKKQRTVFSNCVTGVSI